MILFGPESRLSGPRMFFQGLLVFVLAVAAQPPPPPTIPSYFVADFLEYTATMTNPPPYVDGIPQGFQLPRSHLT